LRRLRNALPVVVSVATFAWLLSGDQIDLGRAFRSVGYGPPLVLLAAALLYVAISLGIEVWSLVRVVGLPRERFAPATAARIKCASYLAYTIHYSLGVGALTILLRRRVGLALSDAAGVVLLIAAFDLGQTLLVATTGLVLIGTDLQALRAGVIVGGGLAIAGGFALLRAPVSLGPLERLRELTLFRAARETPLPRIAELFVLRLVFVLWFFTLTAVALRIFGVSPPLPVLFVNVSIVVLVSALPIAVAGLGTSNAAFVLLFRDYADKDTLFVCSLALWMFLILMRAGLGLVFAREYAREAIEAARLEEEGT
jgi:uncharacterized membrane protein YbhN (UPF0104 family)